LELPLRRRKVKLVPRRIAGRQWFQRRAASLQKPQHQQVTDDDLSVE
jgi:hypothetical protein